MLAQAIESARRRLGLNNKQFAERVGLTVQALLKIKRGGGVNGDTLGKLQERGGVRVTKRLIASLVGQEAKAA